MLDERLRRAYLPLADAAAGSLYHVGVRAGHLTLLGLLMGLGAAAALLVGIWPLALVLWIANRVLDGLDGPLARRAGATDLGGFLDFASDLLVYAAIPLALMWTEPSLRVPLGALVALFYVNVGLHLSLVAILEKRRAAGQRQERSLLLLPGLAEGFETIVLYTALVALPAWRTEIAWAFALLMVLAIGQRISQGVWLLREGAVTRKARSTMEDAR